MNHNSMRYRYSRPSTQRGIATILLVVMVGLALTATAFSIMHTVRSGQEKQVALHASTNAQNGLWTGVEAFGRYLGALDKAALLALDGAGSFDIELDADDTFGQIKVQNLDVTQVGTTSQYQVYAELVNTHGFAHSSAAVGVTFVIDQSDGTTHLSAALHFQDDLTAAGQITFVTPDGTKPSILVDGDVNMLSVGASDLGQLTLTGTARLDSQVNVDEINANGDVHLSGAAWADSVFSRGSVFTSGGAGGGSIWANKTVSANGSPSTSPIAINAIGDITIGSGSISQKIIKGGGKVTSSIESYKSIESIYAAGDIDLKSTAKITTIVGEKNIRCPNPGWKNFTTASVNGTKTSCTSEVVTGAGNAVAVMDPLAPVVVPQVIVDVWPLKNKANYVVEYDAPKGRTKVTVQNVANQGTATEFWIGNYADGTHNDYLCTAFNASGHCTAPATPTMSFCLGHSVSNPCLSYVKDSNTWTLNGTSTVPGIIWFNGNVMLDNGYNYATFLATGNVKTGGQFRGISANYGGFQEICKAKGTNIGMSSTYNDRFKNQYPTNLCDMSANKYLPIPTGNIGIAAGGYDPAGTGYKGGNITLAANNEVWGTILAGGILVTGGQTRIYGYVSAAVLGENNDADNELGGSTVVDLTKKTASYDPTLVPDMDTSPCVTGCTPGGEKQKSRLLWSIYL